MKGLIKQVRNAGNEFMKGYRLARYAQIGCINSYTSELAMGYDFESQIAAQFAKHNIKADIMVKDTFNGPTLMGVIRADYIRMDGYMIQTKNDAVLMVDRMNTLQNHSLYARMKNPILQDISIEDLTEIIIAHEIGHLQQGHLYHADQDYRMELLLAMPNITDPYVREHKLTEIANVEIRHEEEAWDAGRTYVSKRLHSQYEAFNELNLKIYKHTHNTRIGKKVFA